MPTFSSIVRIFKGWEKELRDKVVAEQSYTYSLFSPPFAEVPFLYFIRGG
jgi:hypothetical protein